MLCLSEQGLYFFLARSDKPKALPFQKWIAGEVLPAIRKTGEYATPKVQKEKADKSDQLARKRLEVMERNANWRMAKLILEGMNVFADVMTEESRTVFMAKYGELVAQGCPDGQLYRRLPGGHLCHLSQPGQTTRRIPSFALALAQGLQTITVVVHPGPGVPVQVPALEDCLAFIARPAFAGEQTPSRFKTF